MNQNNQYNNYDPNIGQPLNNINQSSPTFSEFESVTGQSLDNNQVQMNNNITNNQVQMSNNIANNQVVNNLEQMNNVSHSTVIFDNNDEINKAFDTLKKDFILIAIIHLISTILGVFVLEYNFLVLVLRFGIFSMFICGIMSAKKRSSSAMTFATVSAIFLFLTMGFIEIGLGIFLLVHSSKCSKVVKGK